MTAWIPLTVDERYSRKRLARRVRGLHRAEQQALTFIAEAQTMKRGVCSQALKKAEELGFPERNIRYGIQGRRRDGKLEYPGLLARGIVFVVGGHPKGGLAPGGQGLTPDYAINLDVMMTFIPEVDDESPEIPEPDGVPVSGTPKEETKGTPKGTPSLERGTPKGAPVPPSSLSSFLPTSTRAARDPSLGEQSQQGEKNVGVVGELKIFPSGERISDFSRVPSAADNAAAGHPRASGVGKDNPKGSGHSPLRARADSEKQDESQSEIIAKFKTAFDEVNSASELPWEEQKLWLAERGLSVASVYDVILWHHDSKFRTAPKHRDDALSLYRAWGSEKTLALWTQFLVTEDHWTDTNEQTVRTWLLKDFIDWADQQLKRDRDLAEAMAGD